MQERELLQQEIEESIVQNMLKNKMDVESIHEYTKIPVNKILMIKNKLDS
jgi:hypothetical protein